MDFEWKEYISNNKDIMKEGITTESKAMLHYINHGYKENRTLPCAENLLDKSLDIKIQINYEKTFKKYPQMLHSVDKKEMIWLKPLINNFINLLERKKKSREISQKEFKIDDPDFDFEFYLDNYPDLVEEGIDTQKEAYAHWVTCGKKENRACNRQMMVTRYENNKKEMYLAINNYDVKNQNNINTFNILIRTSNRLNSFENCIKNINLQNIKDNINLFVSYDDKKSLKYLDKYDYINKYFIKISSQKKYRFNLYINYLLTRVNNGWIIFMDDDDQFTDKKSLQIINDNITSEDDLIIWKFLRPDKEIYPANLKNIKFGEIASCSYCFHSKYKYSGLWKNVRGGDFNFFKDLIKKNKNLNIKYIPITLTSTSFDDKIGHFGM
jgi:hypothetical protein